MELLDITGRRLPAKQVLALMIGWLKDDIIADMRRQYSAPVEVKDIHWIITVPAVYSRTTKQFMSESAGQVWLTLINSNHDGSNFV